MAAFFFDREMMVFGQSFAAVESIHVSLYNIHENNEHKDADRRKSWES